MDFVEFESVLNSLTDNDFKLVIDANRFLGKIFDLMPCDTQKL